MKNDINIKIELSVFVSFHQNESNTVQRYLQPSMQLNAFTLLSFSTYFLEPEDGGDMFFQNVR
jgi:hypothetical protein